MKEPLVDRQLKVLSLASCILGVHPDSYRFARIGRMLLYDVACRYKKHRVFFLGNVGVILDEITVKNPVPSVTHLIVGGFPGSMDGRTCILPSATTVLKK